MLRTGVRSCSVCRLDRRKKPSVVGRGTRDKRSEGKSCPASNSNARREGQMAVALVAVAGVVSLAADRACAGRRVQQEWCRMSSCSVARRGGLKVGGVAASSGRRQRISVAAKASGEGVEVETETAGGVLPADQWPDTFGFLNYEDLHAHYEPILFKAEAQPGTYLADVMSKTIYTAFPEQTLSEIEHFFEEISGVPVVDADFKVVGVLSRKDRLKATDKIETKVQEVMSSPAITLSADKTVQEAAVLMLKNKIHRIPIVNGESQVVGIVTRTDIFTALDSKSS